MHVQAYITRVQTSSKSNVVLPVYCSSDGSHIYTGTDYFIESLGVNLDSDIISYK